MAPKTNGKRVVLVDDQEPDTRKLDKFIMSDGPTDQEFEDSEKLNEFLSQFDGAEFAVRIEKLNPATKRWEYVEKVPGGGFDPYEKCSDFGGGEYRLTPVKNGLYIKVGVRPVISIAARPEVKAAPAKPEDSDPLKSPLVALMLQQAQESKREMIELFKVLAAKPEPAKSSTTEVLELVTRLKALEPKDDASKKMMDAVLATLIEKALNPDRGDHEGGESIASQIKDAAAAAKELIPMLAARRGPQQPRLAAPASPQPAKPQEPAPMPETSPITDALRAYVPIFLKWAKRAEDPEVAAEFLVDELSVEVVPLIVTHYHPLGMTLSPDVVYQKLIDASQKPEELEVLFIHAPELTPHREWVMQVVAEAVKSLTTPEVVNEKTKAEPEPSGEPADKGQASSTA